MSKAIKFKNNTYLDSSGIVHNKETLPNFIVGKVISFDKNIHISSANTWFDTGIKGNSMSPGTYAMQVNISSYQVNAQYGEYLSGIVAWTNQTTNSGNADEIPLSKAGHARNEHNIRLRILRQGGSNDYIKLQICDSIAWAGAGAVNFKFRKLI